MKTNNLGGMITDDAMLSSICALFEKSESIALDTEYIRESTYYPQPSLVQISNGTTHALLDILALKDLQPLKKLLAKPKNIKIIHSFEQDLMVLECIDCPIKSSLFDTQLAAAFLGFGHMIGYQALVQECLDISLEKGYARSDWLTRPLSDKQINYAMEDVIYLYELHGLLTQRLQESGKLDWFEEESKRMLEYYYANCFERATPKISGGDKIASAYEKNCLRELAKWREEQAKKANLPRRWLIKDEHLIAVAQNQIPISELIKECTSNIDLDVADLEKRLQSVEYVSPDAYRFSKEDKKLVKKIKLLISQTAKDHEIERSLIASHRQILRFVKDKNNRANMALSSGWRYRIIPQPIKQLIAGNDG